VAADRELLQAPLPTGSMRAVMGRIWQVFSRPAGIVHCGLPPSLSTPLADLTAMVLDTETTGLNVRGDRIISAAGFRLDHGTLSATPSFDRLINPRRPIPAASTAFHGLVDDMMAEAGDFAAHWPELHGHLQEGLVIGHQVYFDLAILGREVRRMGWQLQPPVALDTALLYAALHPSERHRDLTPCCDAFGIEVAGRHSARGDAEATGRLFLAMVPLLLQHGIRTLGEALAFERAGTLQHPRRWQW
jgi:DNA polymerase III alpha subunit (gram-positive type)